jgi:endoglycosylceramidase
MSVRSVEFPDGYQVRITGGQMVSALSAAELVIASNAGASAITVAVTPPEPKRGTSQDARRPGRPIG